MSTLTSFYALSLVYVVVVSTTCTASHGSYPNLHISITVFDSGGRESPFVYDGGMVNITCWCDRGAEERLEVHRVYIIWDFRGFSYWHHSENTLLATGTNTVVTHLMNGNFSIITGLDRAYGCFAGDGDWRSSIIRIPYVFCDPLLVKPAAVCPDSRKFCHTTRSQEAECKELSRDSCVYDYKATSPQHHFKVVCLKRKQHSVEYGLCEAYFTDQAISDILFVATSTSECIETFLLFMYRKDTGDHKELMMDGWDCVDLAKAFSLRGKHTATRDVVCTALDSRKRMVTSKMIRTSPSQDFVIDGFLEKFHKSATPTIAEIVCIGNGSNGAKFQFRTTLLLFCSDTNRPWHSIEEKYIRNWHKKAIYKYTIKVSIIRGLYVCVAEWDKTCHPAANASESATMVMREAAKKGDDNRVIGFNIGVFASSPRVKYNLLYYKLTNWTNQRSQNQLTTGTAPAQQVISATPEVRSSGFARIGFIIAIVIAIICVAALIVIMISWLIYKNVRGRKRHEAKETTRDQKPE